MNRRAFLRSLGLVTAAATVDRKYFFAPAGGWAQGGIVAPITYVVGERGTECHFRFLGSYPIEFSELFAAHPVQKVAFNFPRGDDRFTVLS